jgi:hypothetical protein
MNTEAILMDGYRAVHCRSETGRTWWRLYAVGSHDGISDHKTRDAAIRAMRKLIGEDT